jgi:hypothetical protein
MRQDLPGQTLLFSGLEIMRRRPKPLRKPKSGGKADPACELCAGSGLKPVEVNGVADSVICDCVQKRRPKPKKPRPTKSPLGRVKDANDRLSICWGEASIALGDKLSAKFRGMHAAIARHGVIIAEEIRKMKGS